MNQNYSKVARLTPDLKIDKNNLNFGLSKQVQRKCSSQYFENIQKALS